LIEKIIYLLPRTLPESLYRTHIEPHFARYPDYVYTWEGMKRHTPREGRLYKLSDLRRYSERAGFSISRTEALAPFFGLIRAEKERE
jgi:hypothetical protein